VVCSVDAPLDRRDEQVLDMAKARGVAEHLRSFEGGVIAQRVKVAGHAPQHTVQPFGVNHRLVSYRFAA